MKYFYSLLRFLRNFILSLPGYKDISDPNTSWLSILIPGFLHKGNLYCIDYAIKNLPSDAPVVEIGSLCGLSTNTISYYLKLNDKSNKIICCDSWLIPIEHGVKEGRSPLTISEERLRNFEKDNFVRGIKAFSKHNLPYLIESTSNNFFKLWRGGKISKDILGRRIKTGGKISFCYIDGDHSYAQVKRDFINVDKYLDKGGFVFFDDSAVYAGFEVADLMKEICERKDYKLIIKNPNFLFMKLK